MKSLSRWVFVGGLIVALAGGAWVRFTDLGRTATRADEINFLKFASGNGSLLEIWKHPPWQNQMPLGDSIAIVWARMQPRRTVDEQLVREPFALLGFGTVLLCVVWTWRKIGLGAAWLSAVWLGLAPFLVYHSREAYYYAPAMFFATGAILTTIAMLERLQLKSIPAATDWIHWVLWMLVACLCHMSIWILAAVLGLMLLAGGAIFLRGEPRFRFMKWAMASEMVLLLLMSRWIWQSIAYIVKISNDPVATHIGAPFSWMAPRILPMFFGGTNGVGLLLLLATLASAWWGIRSNRQKMSVGKPPAMAWLTWAVGLGFGATMANVGLTGSGAGKWAYFSGVAPIALVWAATSWDQFWRQRGRGYAWGMGLCGVAVAGLLAMPAWKVMQLDGKTTAYRLLRTWLDENLKPGDVAIVDRWFEPWNEMALYAPSNVFVNFTVPDEPYEQYVGLNWRGRTQALFEQNGAQAFIRLTRNHEMRMGLWTWPEKWFTHRAMVTNSAGVWLRDTGFAPTEDFYFETNRLVVEIFYDTREDIADRARAAGRDVVWFYDRGWMLYKPWQQGDFSDYRVLQAEGIVEIHNLLPEPIRVRGEVSAAASGAPQMVQIGSASPLTFPAGQLSVKSFDLDLAPGINSVPWQSHGQAGALLVQDIRLQRTP